MLARNSNITFYGMLNDLNWKKFESHISLNPNLTWDIITEYPSIDWDYEY